MLDPAVRAVFFDAVGTLIHPEPSAPTVYAAVGRRFGSQLTDATLCDRFRTAFLREEEFDHGHGLRTSEPRERQRWQRIVAAVLDDVTDPAACFEELFVYFSRPEAWRCEPETAGVLRDLASQGLVLGLASNYDSRLRSVVAGLPALAPIRHLVISSEVGWRKPAPAFFEALCREGGLPAAEILFVGDDAVNDYEGARAAGLRAVLFSPGPPARAAGEAQIDRLGQLLEEKDRNQGTCNGTGYEMPFPEDQFPDA